MLPRNYQTSSTLVQCAISDENKLQLFGNSKLCPQAFTLEIYAGMSKLNMLADFRANARTFPNKTFITDFTNRSRGRLVQKLAQVRRPSGLAFVTLTYRDEEYFGDNLDLRDFQNHLENLFKRIEYQYYGCGTMWRKEYKPRKSGKNIGRIAPHAHMILRGIEGDIDDFRAFVADAWSTITGAALRGEKARIDVQRPRSIKHAAAYVSKYVAKLADDEDILAIRFYLYLNRGMVGRHWGMRGVWDLSHSTILPVAAKQGIELKRLMRRWLRARGKRDYAKKMSRNNPRFGMAILGLGDCDEAVNGSEILRMWRHAGELTGWT